MISETEGRFLRLYCDLPRIGSMSILSTGYPTKENLILLIN